MLAFDELSVGGHEFRAAPIDEFARAGRLTIGYPGLVHTMGRVYKLGPWLERCRLRHGQCFTVSSADPRLRPVVVISDEQALKEIFQGGARFAHVSASRRILSSMFGTRSVIVIDGPEHLRRRRMLTPLFHGERLLAYRCLIEEITMRDRATWPITQQFALRARFQAITLDIVSRVVFGLRDSDRACHLHRAITGLTDIVAKPPGETQRGSSDPSRPSEAQAVLECARTAVSRVVSEEIARRRLEGARGEDVLSVLLQARDGEGHGLGDEDIVDDVLSLLLASLETTASALASALTYLSRSPDAGARAVDESRSTNSSDYLDAVIKETLRLQPPLPIIDRVLTAPWQLDGHELPAGTVIAPCMYLVHHDAAIYPEPHEFRPERFLGGEPDGYRWIPFGGGMRRCLGATFAMFEMRIVLATLLTRLEPADLVWAQRTRSPHPPS